MRLLQSRHKYVWLPMLITTMTVAAVVIGLLAFRAVETRQIAMTGDSLALTASAIAGNLDEFLVERLGYLGVVANAPVFKGHDAPAMTEYLKMVKTTGHNYFMWLGATNATGRIIASTDPAILGQDRKTSPWFRAVHDTGMAHVGDVGTFTEAGGVEAVVFTVPIMDPRGTFLGAVTAQVGIPALEEVLTRTVRSDQAQRNFSGTLEYQFLSRDGYAFVDSDLQHKGNVNLKRLGLRSAFLAESGNPGYIEEEHLRRHVPVVTGYARTQSPADASTLRWGILLRVDRNDVLAPTRAVLQNLVIVGVVIWMPLFMMLLWTTGRLRKEWAQEQEESARARAAETALRESEQQARAILDGTLDAIVVLDSGGRITDWNPRAEAIFGWTRDEVLGRSLTETIIPLQYRNAHEQGLRRSVDGGAGSIVNRRIEMTALRRNGAEFPVELTVNVLKNETTYRFAAFITDITERKRAEEALRESEIRFRTVVRATNDVIWDWDLKTNALWWADNLFESFGYRPDEIEPGVVSWSTRIHPDEKDRVLAEIHDAIQRKQPFWSGEYRFRRADGSYAHVYDRGYIHFDEPGLPTRMTGALMDITTRKQTEERLRESETRARAIFEQAPLGMSVINSQTGRFVKINAKFCETLGYSEQEMLDRTFMDITHPEDLQADLNNMAILFAGKSRSFEMNKRYIRKDRSLVWVHLTVVPLWWGEELPRLHIAMVEDITQRKLVEDELQQRENTLRSFYDSAPMRMGIVEVEGDDVRLVSVNEATARLFGTTPEALRNRLASELGTSHENRLLWIQNYRECERTGKPIRFEYMSQTPDGPRWFSGTVSYIGRMDHGPSQFAYFSEDITERKQSREALAASEKRLRTILEAEPECVKVTTEDGVLLDMNAAGLAMIEAASLDQVRGRSVLPNIAPDYRDAFAEVIRRAYRGDPGTLQFVIIGLRGKRRWLETHAVPLRDEHNAAIGVLSISRDITERKRVEDALRSSERVLRTLLKEREQLVQDLHDGIIQSLYAIGMSIEECRRLVEEDPEEAKSKLEQEIADVNAVIRAVRSHLAQGENDLPLSASRFKAELTRVAGTMERANALHFRLKVDQRAAECLTTEERRELLYIAQEAMSNCLRHSNASVANVSLRLGRDRVCLEVEDDGTGFDKQTLHETSGGLRNIERRAAKVGAKMEIVSHREHGTRLRLDVPIHTSPGVPT